jgi:aspartyl-tRNA(Asn)/glutamyl-tRNA(Gln) amidotransferase subunit A
MTLCWTLDKLGPIGLTADDCGLVLDAMAGPDRDDPTAAAEPFRYDPGPASRRFRFGVVRDIAMGCEDSVRASFEASLDVLREVGEVETVVLPDLPWEAVTRTILYAEAASALEVLAERGVVAGLTAPEDRYSLYARDAILAKDYLRALRLRGIMAREVDRVLAGVEVLVAPGRPAVASDIDREFRSGFAGSAPDLMGAVGNGAGLPAVIVPSGLGDRGLPTSLQFMGRAWEENAILAAARAYQARTNWHRRHPPVD